MIGSAQDAGPLGTRAYTREGFLRAGITITKPGIAEYDAGEIGLGEHGKRIRVRRTPESVYHPETLRSARAAIVTLKHPEDGDVTPETYRDLAVGSLAGEPRRTAADHLGADVLIASPDAIRAVQGGSDQASIRYRATFVPTQNDPEADYQTVGPLDINHVALVALGRAGPDIRVQDSKDSTEDDELSMTKDEITQAVRAAVADLKKTDEPASVQAAVADALKPVIERMKSVSDKQDAADRERREAEAKAAAEKSAAAFAEKIRGEERQRFGVLQDAAPFIPDEKKQALLNADTKTILVAALGDRIPDAESRSEEYLHGALTMMQRNKGTAAAPTVGRAADTSAASDAYTEYVRDLQTRHTLGNEPKKGA